MSEWLLFVLFGVIICQMVRLYIPTYLRFGGHTLWPFWCIGWEISRPASGCIVDFSVFGFREGAFEWPLP